MEQIYEKLKSLYFKIGYISNAYNEELLLEIIQLVGGKR